MFYLSERVGLHGQRFKLVKLRTMKKSGDGGSPTASVDDPRLTLWGKWLRRLKLDELPTLWNILKGEMVLVGPRPDVPSEIDSLDPNVARIVLSVKPGLISPATLWNINEDEVLKGEADPHKAYCEKIKPIKYRLNVWYVENKSVWLDVKCLIAFALRFVGINWKIYPEKYERL